VKDNRPEHRQDCQASVDEVLQVPGKTFGSGILSAYNQAKVRLDGTDVEEAG
jgi:hypothetical protein